MPIAFSHWPVERSFLARGKLYPTPLVWVNEYGICSGLTLYSWFSDATLWSDAGVGIEGCCRGSCCTVIYGDRLYVVIPVAIDDPLVIGGCRCRGCVYGITGCEHIYLRDIAPGLV